MKGAKNASPLASPILYHFSRWRLKRRETSQNPGIETKYSLDRRRSLIESIEELKMKLKREVGGGDP
jgi:hypothetical protein